MLRTETIDRRHTWPSSPGKHDLVPKLLGTRESDQISRLRLRPKSDDDEEVDVHRGADPLRPATEGEGHAASGCAPTARRQQGKLLHLEAAILQSGHRRGQGTAPLTQSSPACARTYCYSPLTGTASTSIASRTLLPATAWYPVIPKSERLNMPTALTLQC